jgi:hypothetical protein
VELWDVDDVETLDTYAGKVRVIRTVVTKPDQDPSTWCFAIIGKRARQLSRRTALQIIRTCWHIEDTGFNQWIDTSSKLCFVMGSHCPRPHSLGEFAAEHELTRRRSRAQWAARTHRRHYLFTSPPFCHQGDLLSIS